MSLKEKVDFYSIISGERITGKGEDNYLLDRSEEGRVFLGVFDGCGGSGSRCYQEFGGKTGAYIASRVAALAAWKWLKENKSADRGSLEMQIKKALNTCNERVSSDNVLRGNIIRDFPTTMSAMIIAEDGSSPKQLKMTLFNAGDSRCYGLFPEGLIQLTKDDLKEQDALQSIYDSAPMENMLYASDGCSLSVRSLRMESRGIIFAATDGCFDYFTSPMAFEKMLLKTLEKSGSISEWEAGITEAIEKVAGDDYTLVMMSVGYGSLQRIKASFEKRRILLETNYPETTDFGQLISQWKTYRKGYEIVKNGYDS